MQTLNEINELDEPGVNDAAKFKYRHITPKLPPPPPPVFKVTCERQELVKALTTVSKAVPAKHALSILRNVLLIAENGSTGNSGKLVVAATNLEFSITYEIPATVLGTGEITVPAELLTEFIKNLASSIYQVQLWLDSRVLHVKAGRSEANLTTASADNYPVLSAFSKAKPNNGGSTKTLIASNVLKEAISQVAFAASTDSARPVLTGIYTSFNQDKATLAVADSFRLAVRTAPLISDVYDTFNILLPARAMSELARIMPSDDSLVEISVNANKSQALFKAGNITFTSSLIEGNFPNYQQIIPSPNQIECQVTVDTKQFKHAINTLKTFAASSGRDLSARLTVVEKSGLITLESKAWQVGDNCLEVEAASVIGEAGEFIFNSAYMAEMLAVVGTEQIVLELLPTGKPAIIRPAGNENDYVYVLMSSSLAK